MKLFTLTVSKFFALLRTAATLIVISSFVSALAQTADDSKQALAAAGTKEFEAAALLLRNPDKESREAAIEKLNKAIDLCLQKSDAGTRDLVESVLREEEEAIDWLEAQLKIVSDIGRERYLAEQLHE